MQAERQSLAIASSYVSFAMGEGASRVGERPPGSREVEVPAEGPERRRPARTWGEGGERAELLGAEAMQLGLTSPLRLAATAAL